MQLGGQLRGWLRRRVADRALTAAPDSIRLASSDDRWLGTRVRGWSDELVRRGWAPVGGYVVEELPGTRIAALLLPRRGAAAALIDRAGVGQWVNLLAECRDGRILEFTTRPPGGCWPPWMTVIHRPGSMLAEMDDEFRNALPSGRIRLAAADLPRLFEASYEREVSWRKRGGGGLPALLAQEPLPEGE